MWSFICSSCDYHVIFHVIMQLLQLSPCPVYVYNVIIMVSSCNYHVALYMLSCDYHVILPMFIMLSGFCSGVSLVLLTSETGKDRCSKSSPLLQSFTAVTLSWNSSSHEQRLWWVCCEWVEVRMLLWGVWLEDSMWVCLISLIPSPGNNCNGAYVCKDRSRSSCVSLSDSYRH